VLGVVLPALVACADDAATAPEHALCKARPDLCAGPAVSAASYREPVVIARAP